MLFETQHDKDKIVALLMSKNEQNAAFDILCGLNNKNFSREVFQECARKCNMQIKTKIKGLQHITVLAWEKPAFFDYVFSCEEDVVKEFSEIVMCAYKSVAYDVCITLGRAIVRINYLAERPFEFHVIDEELGENCRAVNFYRGKT